MGAANPAKDLPMTEHDAIEPPHAASPTDLVLNELQLFGYRPFDDQPDPRPLPEGKMIAGAVADIFDAIVATLDDTRLEPDLPDLLWSTVNLFHRAAERINRQLDDNEQAQRNSQHEQNGSEVRLVELERLTAEGITLIERRNCLEVFRDQAIQRFEVHTGSSGAPGRDLGQPSHAYRGNDRLPRLHRGQAPRRDRNHVASRTEGRSHRRARLQRSPFDLGSARQGPCQASRYGANPWRFDKGRRADRLQTGDRSKDATDRFQAGLDEACQGSALQAQRRHARTAAIGVMHFPGTGIQDNLADKAKRLGIAVWKFGGA
jgi:hypothetical protein